MRSPALADPRPKEVLAASLLPELVDLSAHPLSISSGIGPKAVLDRPIDQMTSDGRGRMDNFEQVIDIC